MEGVCRLAWQFGFVVVATLTIQSAALGQQPPLYRVASFAEYSQRADAPTASPEYQQLVQRLEATEARLQQLERGATPAPQSHDHPPVHADGNPRVPSAEQRITALERAVGASASPHFPSVRATGFFHLDAGLFGQDAANRATLGDIQDGVGFRRARLQAVGNVTEFTTYSIEMDFATAGRPSFMDVWGEQQQLPWLGNLRIGHYRQPTTMDSLTSIRQLEFLERSLPFQAFDPFRRVGLMAYDKSTNEMWSWAYGVYRTGGFNNAPLGDSRFANDIGDQGGYSFAGRLTHLLYYDEAANGRYLLHVGGHYNYGRMTASSSNPVPYYQAQAVPEFFVGDAAGGGLTANGTPPFVNTGRLAANSYDFFGVQLAGQCGPTHLQAEYMATTVNQIANPQVFYDGAYVQGGYFLTGESRTYNRTFGVFDRVTPHTDFFTLGRHGGFCGWGAWELVARWSYVNLNDRNAVPMAVVAGPPPTPDPGRLNNSTLGLNWYWNPYSKVQFNWIHAFLDNAAAGNSDCDIYCARFQVEF